MKLIDKHKFAKAVLDKNSEIFIVHIVVLEATGMTVYISQANLVPSTQLAMLKWDKALNKILAEYRDYAEVFSLKLTMEFSKNTGINENVIDQIEGKQPPYRLIYIFSQIKLEMSKTYIKTHLKTGFIWPFNFLAKASIFFDKKLDSNFCLYIDYRDLNNVTIKN